MCLGMSLTHRSQLYINTLSKKMKNSICKERSVLAFTSIYIYIYMYTKMCTYICIYTHKSVKFLDKGCMNYVSCL